MIKLYSRSKIEGMKESGEILAKTHLAIGRVIKAGMTTKEINDFGEAFMLYKNSSPEQKGYEGFPSALCTSVNDVICHGFPSEDDVLKDGDIVSIDNVVNYKGYLSDSCWSYKIGELSDTHERLFNVTRESLNKGIEKAKIGNRIGDIGNAIQTYVESEGFSVIREFVGHGIGDEMHEDPQVPHYGSPHRGQRLREGMIITIEPMIAENHHEMYVEDNGWVARTKDHGFVCQFEHTMAITKEGPEILTNQDDTYLTDEELEWISNYKF